MPPCRVLSFVTVSADRLCGHWTTGASHDGRYACVIRAVLLTVSDSIQGDQAHVGTRRVLDLQVPLP